MKHTDLKNLLRLLRYMGERKLFLLCAGVCTIVSSVCAVHGTNLLRPIINDCIVPLIGDGSPEFGLLFRMIVTMGIYYLVSALTLLAETEIMIFVCNDTIFRLRLDMFSHMQRLPVSWFDTHSAGEIMSRYNSDIDVLANMLKQGLPQLVSGAVTIVSILISMVMLSPPLLAVVLICTAVIVMVNTFLFRRNKKYQRRQQSVMGDVNGFAVETIRNHDIMKHFAMEEETAGRFDALNGEYVSASMNSQLYAGSIFPLGSGLSNMGFAAIALAGVLLAARGMTDIGTIAAFLQHYKRFYTPVMQISRQVNNLIAALSGAERIFSVMDAPAEEDEGTTVPSGGGLAEGIAFNDVFFGYQKDAPVIKGISFELKAGGKMAIVGSSGAGKSTVIYLLNRFYEPGSGDITIDGISVRQIPKGTLRGMISIVLQDTHLFTGTIMDNIRFGRPDASDDEIIAAAKKVHADYFISHLPMGYKTPITEDGSMLSEGQKQLISIARAAVSDAPILIMDEATGMVDTRTERLIGEGLKALMEKRTILMVAHRLETVRSADIIAVMKDGLITEIGSHETLMQEKGLYYELNMGSKELL